MDFEMPEDIKNNQVANKSVSNSWQADSWMLKILSSWHQAHTSILLDLAGQGT